MIEDLSDGGALLSFSVMPPRASSYRLVIDDTPFSLVCEPRHTAGNKMGVKFIRLAEGVALNRHFQRVTVEPAAMPPPRPIAPISRPAADAMGIRDLRSKVLSAIDEEPPLPPVSQAPSSPAAQMPAQPVRSSEELLAAGYLPQGVAGLDARPVAATSKRPPRIRRSSSGAT